MEGLLNSDELVLPGNVKVTKSENLLMAQKGSLSLAFEVYNKTRSVQTGFKIAVRTEI